MISVIPVRQIYGDKRGNWRSLSSKKLSNLMIINTSNSLFLIIGFGRRSRPDPHQTVRSCCLIQRNSFRRIKYHVFEQISQQAQQAFHEGLPHARWSCWGYWFWRSLSKTRFQDPWSLLGWQIRIWHHWSQKDLVFRSRHHGTQYCYWCHQGSPILEWNQGLCYCWIPMGFKRGMSLFLIAVDFYFIVTLFFLHKIQAIVEELWYIFHICLILKKKLYGNRTITFINLAH